MVMCRHSDPRRARVKRTGRYGSKPRGHWKSRTPFGSVPSLSPRSNSPAKGARSRGKPMTGTQALRTAAIAAIACAFAAPAWADTEIDELVVTARKREERLRDVPAAATALSAEDIR